ncbi:hypothetical protein QCA50_008244 [Cerrena zonata]|uniref:Uncharacterized protein n=1 Tax=Cerrena zonata TaxID=2478898 RepID=A0AAW0G7P3_9APHY
MGATLSSLFGSSSEEDEVDREAIQYSRYPFSAGLADIMKVNVSESSGNDPEAGASHDTRPSNASTCPIRRVEDIELQMIV